MDGSAAASHPLDDKYAALGAALTLVDTEDAVYSPITKYVDATMGRQVQLENVWAVDSAKQSAAFEPFSALDNHKLLWHGTNVAVVAAILSGGLRIMEHSGACLCNVDYAQAFPESSRDSTLHNVREVCRL